jgi:hypothetical protein
MTGMRITQDQIDLYKKSHVYAQHKIHAQEINFFCKRIKVYSNFGRSRDIVVGIATGYGLDDRGVGVRVPVGSRIFSSSRRPDRIWSPSNLLSNGSFPGEKRRRRKSHHSPPPRAQVKKIWIYTSTSPYAFIA